jgi:2-polyprenyl-3-methyl-5-hydroxy-6-metoxy-1,4-benzoquinol methylase
MTRLLGGQFDPRLAHRDTRESVVPTSMLTTFTHSHPKAMEPWLNERGLLSREKLLDRDVSREYYRHVCHGDSLQHLEPDNYEAPRLQWILDRASGGVLDAGCCTGELCHRLEQQGCWVIGLDPSERHIATARERYPKLGFICSFVEDHAQEVLRTFDGKWRYDTVVAGDVLEHVPDDRAFLAACRSVGRQVLLTTPFGFWDSPEHLREYSVDSAQALIEGLEGTVEVINDRSGNPRWLGIYVRGEREE